MDCCFKRLSICMSLAVVFGLTSLAGCRTAPPTQPPPAQAYRNAASDILRDVQRLSRRHAHLQSLRNTRPLLTTAPDAPGRWQYQLSFHKGVVGTVPNPAAGTSPRVPDRLPVWGPQGVHFVLTLANAPLTSPRSDAVLHAFDLPGAKTYAEHLGDLAVTLTVAGPQGEKTAALIGEILDHQRQALSKRYVLPIAPAATPGEIR